MVQDEIIDFLESVDEILTSRQIAEQIGFNLTQVRHALPKLVKWKEIKFIELDRVTAARFLGEEKYTRRLRFFFNQRVNHQEVIQARLAALD